ncbi:putative Ig domain-containing protein [Pontiella sp.]|uniref:putative Ig domain-containing protein n=1 Tax=Pontiella sp. TaxID=2837462 RepID=UPI003568608F
MKKSVLIAGLTAFLAFGTAQAAIVNVDLTGNTSRGPVANMLPGVVGATSNVTWNAVTSKNLFEILKTEDGTGSGASFQVTGTSSVNFGSTTGSTTSFFNTFANLINSGTPGAESTNSFTIGGLASATVDLYLYATWEYIDAGSEFRVSGDGGSSWTDWQLCSGVPSEDDAGFTNGQSYVVFSGVNVHTDGTVLGEWQTTTNGASSANRGMFNAIQIVGDFEDAPAPAFTSSSFTNTTASAGIAYSDSIAGTATGSELTYSLATAGTWLSVAADGTLSGTPAASNTGLNSFSVVVTDYLGRTDTATLYIEVVTPPARYTDTFDGDGLGVNTGEGGGLVLKTFSANYLSVTDTNTALVFATGSTGNVGAERSAVCTENLFSVANGFSLEVVYNINSIPGTLSETAGFGLVDSVAALDGAFTFPKTYNYFGISLTTRNGQGLNLNTYTEGDESGVLTNLSNDQTITAGTSRTATLTVDADGNYTYSIDGQTPTTGTTTFDLSKGYYFAIHSQRPSTGFSVESVSFIPNASVTEIGNVSMQLTGTTAAGFTWYGEYGATYELQTRESLTVGGEEAWQTVTSIVGNDADITISDDLDATQAFYRIKLAE